MRVRSHITHVLLRMLMLLLLFGCRDLGAREPQQLGQLTPPAAESNLSNPEIPAHPLPLNPGLDGETHLVAYVVDGDTIILENGERVRYIGIDAPETSHPTKGIECYGLEAAARNRELVEGKRVRLEKDQSERDKYDRLLRYVYLDDLLINAQLVAEGFAYAAYYPPDTRYYPALAALELQAEHNKLGLWNACQRP